MHSASAVGITGRRQQHSAACVSDDGDDPEDGRDNLADMVPLNSNSTRTLWPVECINDWTGLCRHLSSHSQLPHCYGDCQKYEHTTVYSYSKTSEDHDVSVHEWRVMSASAQVCSPDDSFIPVVSQQPTSAYAIASKRLVADLQVCINELNYILTKGKENTGHSPQHS